MRHVATMRERDKGIILDVVRRFGPLSRVEIHELTQLRPASISLLTRELIRERKVREAGLSDNPTGRKQILLQLNEEAGIIIAVDFDAESVMAAPLDCRPSLRGPIIKEATNLREGLEGLMRQLFSCARQAISAPGIDPSRVLGIGVGDPGLVDRREGLTVLSSTIDFWKDVRLGSRFEAEFGLPCVVENSTRTRAVAERMLGAGDRSDDMIFVEYGWGIGTGIISGGRTLQGSRWSAGEFGHTHITESGPPCSCGSFGCLEAVAGIGALETRMRDAIRQGGYSQCLAMAGGEVDQVNGWQVLAAARQGDKMSIALVEELGTHLGLGLANMVNLFNPSLVVLDRRLAVLGDLLLDQITRIVRRQALAHSTEQLQFRFAALGSEVGLLGAGLVMLDSLLEVPALKPPLFLLDRSLQAKARRYARHRSAVEAPAKSR